MVHAKSPVEHRVEERRLPCQHTHVYGAGLEGHCLRVCHGLQLQVLHGVPLRAPGLVVLLKVLCIQHLHTRGGFSGLPSQYKASMHGG